jgi:radical SAM superfamily enzyme YgiQ (UPF0313 family)
MAIQDNEYAGFEQGPIRPPNEAQSLLVRITRNCPWNRCAFCPVYKREKFSVRPAEHVKRDIDLVHKHVDKIKHLIDESGRITPSLIHRAGEGVDPDEWPALIAAAGWVIAGDMKSVFLQDADSLVIKPSALVDILTHLKRRFPSIERITSYSRAKTIARREDADLGAIREAGLDRIHIGLESGSDRVLAMVEKGSTKAIQIEAGLKVKAAGMELSEYVMPGLGGHDFAIAHAMETADALNQIDPDFIRIRTLALTPRAPLFSKWQSGDFKKSSDRMVAEEILLLLERLDGITSVVKSDHILNMFMDLEGKLPDDKDRMLGMLREFLTMSRQEQRLYQTGRRLGIFRHLGDLQDLQRRETTHSACRRLGITPENADAMTDQLMMRFV